MIKKLLLPSILCFHFLQSTQVSAQLPTTPPLVSVTGSAEVKVAPDEVYLSVGVETKKETLEEATQENNAQVAQALAYLKKAGVEDKNVQTDYVSIQPDYRVNETVPFMYYARKSIQVKLTDVKSMEPVLAGLLTNGVNHVHSIDFRTSELRKYRDQARTLAIKAAKEKAEALVSELGIALEKVYSITANDGNGMGWWYGGNYWGGSWGQSQMAQNVVQNTGGATNSEGGSLSIGQISVSANVNVSFLIK